MRGSVGIAALFTLFSMGLLAIPSTLSAQSAADSTAIEAAALDYIQGYYSGDAQRMERALHPDLAKRIVRTNPANGRSALEQMSAMTLVQITRGMAQRPVPEEQRQDDVKILDIFGNVASVRVDATQWIDYLHLAKWNGEWKIVNVLWEVRGG
ncbi:nuclear transport factor 2 family protein [Gemmatimonadota bacterium]